MAAVKYKTLAGVSFAALQVLDGDDLGAAGIEVNIDLGAGLSQRQALRMLRQVEKSIIRTWPAAEIEVPEGVFVNILSISPANATEGNAGGVTVTMTVSLSQAAGAVVTVPWSIAGFGANPANGADFVGGALPAGTITIPAGQTSGTASWQIAGDADEEPTEAYRVTLGTPAGGGAVLGPNSTANGTIINDDSAPPAGVVSAVAVHADGNRLLATLNGPAITTKFIGWPDDGAASYNHPMFPRNVDGLLNVVVTVQSPGYARSGGAAVATPQTRTLNATLVGRGTGDGSTNSTNPLWWPKQYPVDANSYQIELWLENCIYATDTITGIAFAAGWMTSAVAQNFGAQANGSALACPPPITRNINLPNHLVRGASGTMRIDYECASHFPRNDGANLHQALAGLKVTAYDTAGNSVSKWVFGESLSTQYGDSYYCWGLDVLASGLFTGLTPGLISVHHEAFPWIGASWSSGTGNLNATGTPARQIGPDQPLMVYYDPAGTLFPDPRYIVCDPVGGSTTIASITAGASDTLAVAKAQAVKPLNVSAAIAKMRALNADVSNVKVVVPAGTTQFGSVSISGITGNAGFEIIGDPDDASPRVNCIFDLETSLSGAPVFAHYRRCRLNRTASPIPNGGFLTLNQVDFVTATSNPNLIASAPADALAAIGSAAGVNWVGPWWSTHSHQRTLKLQRSATGGAVGGVVIVNCNTGAAGAPAYSPLWTWGDCDFRMIVNCITPRRGDDYLVSGAPGGTRFARLSRFAYVNIGYERKGSSWNFRAFQWEDVPIREAVLEGITIAGAGWNWHNWKGPDVFGLPGRKHGSNRVANVIFHRLAHKGDNEPEGYDTSVPLAERGYVSEEAARAGLELMNGVGFDACVNLNIVSPTATNNLSWFGRRSVQVLPVAQNVSRSQTAWVDDRCHLSANPTTDDTPGNYRLGASSTVRTIGRTSNKGRYVSGVTRPAQFAPGAYEAV